MGKNILEKIICTWLIGGSLFIGSMAEAGVETDRLPLTCYADHKVITYNSPGAKSAGYISANVDLIQITQVRGDGWCYGSYPGVGGRRVSRWFKITDICVDAGYTNRSANVKGRQTVYRTRSGGATIGSVSNNEGVIVIADNGSRAQIVYRLDNGTGYKLGWIPSAAVATPALVPTQSHNPEGNFEGVESKGDNQITVSGWAMDRDDAGKSLSVHVYIGGPAGSGAEGHEIVANRSRPDVQNWYSRQGLRTGIYYGFNNTIKVTKTGRQDVYVYAINIGGGTNVELGHKTVEIKSASVIPSPKPVPNINQYRQNALNAAKEMVEIRWTSPCNFVTWCSSKGVYNTVTAADGTRAAKFIAGKQYTGIPYSMEGRTYTKDKFLNYVNTRKSTNYYQKKSTQYTHRKLTTAVGIDCSYFVWSAINSSGATVKIGGNYTTTGILLNSGCFVARSYEAIKPGDIFIKNGHVMMVAENQNNNYYVVYEAVADKSKCSKSTYSRAYLINQGYKGYSFTGYGD